ncbi:AT-rich interactive domain-containing protein 5B-like [Arapaima gigas]
MEPNSLKWVGSPCGLHGSYIFYKAFKFHLDSKPRILSLGDFFLVRCKPEDPICIAELQLLWEDKASKQLLSSSKLYFLPEDTPQGRTVSHGEDEIVAASEKVIVKLEDLVKWAVPDSCRWECGLRAVPLKPSVVKELGQNGQREALHKFRESMLNSGLNFKDVLKEKAELGEDEDRRILVLSYPQYCRYRSVIARLRERPSSLLTDQVVLALGGIAALDGNTQILYCRETFEHATLIENESICDKLAPNLKGRPRKKKPSISQRRDSQGLSIGKETAKEAAKESSGTEGKASVKIKTELKAAAAKPKSSSSGGKKASADERPNDVAAGEECRADEQAFLVSLYKYMKDRKTPIERIPYLGFKQINLWTMFQAAQKLGGYELITARRQWKNVYDELGGNPGSTSAATCTRRHYERYVAFVTLGCQVNKPSCQVNNQPSSSSFEEVVTRAVHSSICNDAKNPYRFLLCLFIYVCSLSSNLHMSNSKEESHEVHQPQQHSLLNDRKPGDEEEELELTVKEETLSSDVPETRPLLHALPSENGPAKYVTEENLQKHSEESKHELQELQEESNDFCQATSHSLHQSHDQEQWHNGVSVYNSHLSSSVNKETPSHVGMVLPTLKQKPLQTPPASEILASNGELPGKEESCFSYLPVLYPRSNPGIMSPLAKKKLLSQVSGTALPNNYSFGPPPPLVSKKCISRSPEDVSPPQSSQIHATQEPGMINRPSVIQLAHSFKSRGTEEQRSSCESLKVDLCGISESFKGTSSQSHPQPSPTGESYLLSTDCHHTVEKTGEKTALYPSKGPNFLSDFYSSPNLNTMYRQTDHHLSKEPLTKYLNRELLFSRDCEVTQSYSANKNPENVVLSYCSSSEKEKIALEDQPTDLSLPKSTQKPASSKAYSIIHQEMKTPPLFQTSSLEYHPKACRVPPMTVATQNKAMDIPLRTPGKMQNSQDEDIICPKIEDLARPILSSKCSPQNIGAARPLKRKLEELENGIPEKKIRAVTPMHSVKDTTAGKSKTPDSECGGLKPADPVQAVHVNSYVESHKFPLHSPIFPGLYPGTFLSQVQDMCDSLGSRLPSGYSHQLQYLKNQAVVSPLVPPFTIHSLMMQRQLLATAGSPPHLYRHPVGASYGDILHHSLYPLSALSSQPAFSPPQLSSVHPSTKLS